MINITEGGVTAAKGFYAEATSVGMKEADMKKVAGWIDRVCANIGKIDEVAPQIRSEIAEFCGGFKFPGA